MSHMIKVLAVVVGMPLSLLAAPQVAIPPKLDLAPDFKPSAAQLAYPRPFGFPGGRGCEMGIMHGLRPLYITHCQQGVQRGEPLAIGDVLVAVDGEPLVADPIGLLNRKFNAAKEKKAKLSLTRWRAGSMTNVLVTSIAENPDFTQGDHQGDWHDWTLGPTGLRGWIFGSQCQTREARQILVTDVATNSPADGVIAVGDVILGIGGQKFSDDARIQFARAIAAAEAVAGGGSLRITRWRAGVVATAELKLKVMGSYSDTAPFDCPKSKNIFEQGCAAIAKRGLKDVCIPSDMNALALLASGKAEYRPMLAAYAKQLSGHQFGGYKMWDLGYANMFLAEYVLATGDQTVSEGLKRITMEIVNGQSAVGTWGHYPALPNGNISGYGCMNQPGLSLSISLVLAREAGVKDPALDRAIAKTVVFLRWYANKGAIPYGDHQPWNSHDDGGKTGSAAVLFDLLGDHEAAEFFAKMSAAGYIERETAHVGNVFCFMWALPAVIRCGPVMSGAYLTEQSWYYDLARSWDGSLLYQGPPQGGQEMGKFTKWDCTGAYLLAFAAPLKSLYLTGKRPFSFPALNRAQTAEVIAAGRDFMPGTEMTCYEGRTTEQLLAGLSNWSPAVRYRSALSLGRRQEDFMPAVLKTLASPKREPRYGACEALTALGPRADAAAPQLRALLKDADPWLQSLACRALSELGPEARTASVPDLLHMAATPNPADPRHVAQRAAGAALFDSRKGILCGTLNGVDRQLLFPAIESILNNEDGAARGSAAGIYGKLTDRDLAVLLPSILKASEKLAPSGEMFAEGIRVAGLDLLTRRHIREGMLVCVSMSAPKWGSQLVKSMEYLKRYGVHAKEVLPQLQEMRGKYAANAKTELALIDKTMADIEASTQAPQLVSLKDFVDSNKK